MLVNAPTALLTELTELVAFAVTIATTGIDTTGIDIVKIIKKINKPIRSPIACTLFKAGLR